MKRSIATIQALVASAGTASVVVAQAPSSAQVWDVRFVVDSAGAFAAGPAATAVGITIMARVGILPNTSASGTSNFGVSRVGGSGSATSGFRVTFTDSISAAAGRSQGSVHPGETGDTRTLDPVTGAFSLTGVPTLLRDTSGDPLRGHFAPFRGSFSPQVGPLFLGSNTDPANGVVINPLIGSPVLTNLVGSRTLNFGSDGSGPVGVAVVLDPWVDPVPYFDMAFVYRLVYLPSDGPARIATLDVLANAMTARYIHTINGAAVASGSLYRLPAVHVEFAVPGPGYAAWGVGATLAAIPRRRATCRQR